MTIESSALYEGEEYERHYSSRRNTPRRESRDSRTPGRKDRDRIYYSESYHRLADITQIIRKVESRDIVLHNRSLHSQKVAALARELAERFGDIRVADPEVADAAGLGHDLGHPPFGHTGERTLNRLLAERGLEGFEGNAQTFRVVTKLAWRHAVDPGLDLTRRTLRSLLKYPYLRDTATADPAIVRRGVYSTEKADFDFATYDGTQTQSVEGLLADIADDITFALHDLEDFYRSNVLELARLERIDDSEFFDQVLSRSSDEVRSSLDKDAWGSALDRLRSTLARADYRPLTEPYESSKLQYGVLRSLTSHMIDRWAEGVTLDSKGVIAVDSAVLHEIVALKEFVFQEVILGWPPVQDAQVREIGYIELLFEYVEEKVADARVRLPRLLIETLESALVEDDVSIDSEEELRIARTRGIADYISRLTEKMVVDHVSGIRSGIWPPS